MTQELLRAEFDSVQVTIIVLAVIFSFLKWLWEQWRGKKEEAGTVVIDEVERKMREEAWRRQTGQQPPPSPPQPSRPAPPAVAPRPVAEPLPGPPQSASPWEEIRKAWRELREAAQQQQQQPPPAPSAPRPNAAQSPQRRQQRPQQPQPPPPAQKPPVVEKPPVVAQPVAFVAHPAASPLLESLRQLRHDPAAMRRAIVLSEVLSAPKAMHG